MTVTKSQIVNGVVNYAKSEILTKISDKPIKMMLAAGISALEANPAIADNVFRNEIFSAILNENDGAYDIDVAFEIVEKTMDEYGGFPITIPAVKFISPNEKQLTFSSGDVKKLKQYITGGEA